MRLKGYQLETLDKLDGYVGLLATALDDKVKMHAFLAQAPEPMREKLLEAQVDPAVSAWRLAQERGIAASPDDWRPLLDGWHRQVPHLCLELPTGSGKTLIAGHAVGRVLATLDKAMTGFVLWVMPSEAIYTQTRAQLRDKAHPVRQALEAASGGRVKLAEKASDFTRADIDTGLVVMTLMLQSAGRRDKDTLKVFRDSGNYSTFYPDADDATEVVKLLAAVPNLETNDLADGMPGSVKQSLGNTLRLVRPIIVLDEGHRAYSETARQTLGDMNPRFILELTATPDRTQSNILVKVGGQRLRDAEMIKLPIQLVADENAHWKDTLKAALDKRAALEAEAREHHHRTDRYIRPILLVRVERTGRDQRDGVHIHTEDVFEELTGQMGVPPDWVRRQTAVDKELDDTLMRETSAVRVIITKDALREGWDCPFAYVLALLSKTQARTALTQMIGRVLRQPAAKRTDVPDLDSAWVFCADLEVKDAVDAVRLGLDQEGMGDLKASVRGAGEPPETRRIERRNSLKTERVLIPTVTHQDGKGGYRPLDFDADILGEVDWGALHYEGAVALNLDDAGAARARTRFDYGAGGTLERMGVVERVGLDNAIDRPDLARRLLGLIPNPWIGIALVDEGLAALRARGIADEAIAKGRLDLLNSIRAELGDKIDAQARAVFESKLAHQVIQFRLHGRRVDWEMTPWVEMEFRPGHDLWEVDKDGNALGRTLFEHGVKRGDLNGFEKDVALYLDGSSAVAWWWRLASRGTWGLQGWRRHKVYPDFLLRLNDTGRKLLVLETKGQHLDNDDTAFKRELMAALGAAYATPSPGEIELYDDAPELIRFKMLMETVDWKPSLAESLT